MLSNKLIINPTNIHKGFTNNIGENNCFINVILQALWHLGPFRAGLQAIINERMMNHVKSNNNDNVNNNLIESLVNIFINYEYNDLSIISSNDLRQALSSVSETYSLGNIADANETLDTVLNMLHSNINLNCSMDKQCLSHKVFGGTILQQTYCSNCKYMSEPIIKDDIIQRTYAYELLNKSNDKNLINFGQIINSCINNNAIVCPSSLDMNNIDNDYEIIDINDFQFSNDLKLDYNHNINKLCQSTANVKTYCLEAPLALAININWSKEYEDINNLIKFYNLINLTIDLNDLYITNQSNEWKNVPDTDIDYCDCITSPTVSISTKNLSHDSNNNYTYLFRGMICYYGLHYISIFEDVNVTSNYILFDDTKMRSLGNWKNVINECIKSHYQPVLLLYELSISSNNQIVNRSEVVVVDSPGPKVRINHKVFQLPYLPRLNTLTNGLLTNKSVNSDNNNIKDDRLLIKDIVITPNELINRQIKLCYNKSHDVTVNYIKTKPNQSNHNSNSYLDIEILDKLIAIDGEVISSSDTLSSIYNKLGITYKLTINKCIHPNRYINKNENLLITFQSSYLIQDHK